MFDARPEAFGSYRVLAELDAGRFGPVYHAQDASGAPFVVKVFDQNLTPAQAGELAAALEHLCRAPLDHPSIIPMFAVGVDGTRVWVVEPWIDAPSLFEVMTRDGVKSLSEVLVRLTQLAGALDFAAAAGIHHGALHPSEIFVTADHTLLTGLGVLQALADADLEVPMQGAYVSPQRAEGLTVNAVDDIFSLAAITLELLTGNVVPEREGIPAALAGVSGVDRAGLARVLQRALSPEAAQRPATALEFAAALQQVAVDGPEPPKPVEPEPPKPIQRSEASPRIMPAATPKPAVDPDDLPLAPRDTPRGPEWDVEPVFASAERVIPDAKPEPELRFAAEPDPRPMFASTSAGANQFADSAPRHRRSDSLPEPRRSSLWFAIAASLAIGVLTGFAAGFVTGQRDHTPVPRSAERAVARDRAQAPPAEEKPASTVGQAFTESAVPQQGLTAQSVTEHPVVPMPAQAQPDAASPARTAPIERSQPAAPIQQPASPPRSGPGSLEVDSRPQGARVFVDERLVGTTPVLVPDVTPGAHAVRIDLAGHRRWVTSVDVAPGTRHRVAASLER